MMGEDAETVGAWSWQEVELASMLRRRRRIKRIVDHTDAELDVAVAVAVDKIPGFWKIMHGVDAYMERRKRKSGRSPSAEELSRATLEEEAA